MTWKTSKMNKTRRLRICTENTKWNFVDSSIRTFCTAPFGEHDLLQLKYIWNCCRRARWWWYSKGFGNWNTPGLRMTLRKVRMRQRLARQVIEYVHTFIMWAKREFFRVVYADQMNGDVVHRYVWRQLKRHFIFVALKTLLNCRTTYRVIWKSNP